jgi:hypothetical protein
LVDEVTVSKVGALLEAATGLSKQEVLAMVGRAAKPLVQRNLEEVGVQPEDVAVVSTAIGVQPECGRFATDATDGRYIYTFMQSAIYMQQLQTFSVIADALTPSMFTAQEKHERIENHSLLQSLTARPVYTTRCSF